MKRLLDGLLEFRRNLTPEAREAFARLATTQHPDTLFIACSDSRVVPNLFASTHPGDLFVIRNAGNIVPGWSPQRAGGVTASICYALQVLPITDVVICGHTQCGAMNALLFPDTASCEAGMDHWLRHGPRPDAPSDHLDDPPPDPNDRLGQINVLLQMEHVRTFPEVIRRESEGSLHVHGWWFDVGRAEVSMYQPSARRFTPIDEASAASLLWEHELRRDQGPG